MNMDFCLTFGAGVIVGVVVGIVFLLLMGGSSEIEDDFDGLQ